MNKDHQTASESPKMKATNLKTKTREETGVTNRGRKQRGERFWLVTLETQNNTAYIKCQQDGIYDKETIRE